MTLNETNRFQVLMSREKNDRGDEMVKEGPFTSQCSRHEWGLKDRETSPGNGNSRFARRWCIR